MPGVVSLVYRVRKNMHWKHLKNTLAAFLRILTDAVFPGTERFDWEHLRPEEFLATALPARRDYTLQSLPGEALFAYRDPLVREAIHALKYRRVQHAGFILGMALADHLREECAYERLFSRKSICIVPIPLSAERLRERGFNQSERIAQHAQSEISPESACVCSGVLVRVIHTEHQTRMDAREARAQNIRGCFAVADVAAIRGRRVILIDDVITTGATMREAREALLDAGARSVACVAIAH